MTTQYIIHPTDPFKQEYVFNVREYTTDGAVSPISSKLTANTQNYTSVSAHTSLIFYGKGHPEYGERMQENVVQLLENFAGNAAPVNAIPGQIWYARYERVKTNSGWFVWNSSTSMWDQFVPIYNGISTGAPGANSLSVNHGDYIVITDNPAEPILRQAVKISNHPLNETWVTHDYFKSYDMTNPNNAGFNMITRLRVFENGEWIDTSVVHVGGNHPEEDMGRAWFDTNNDTLKVWNGSSWFVINPDTTIAADLDMNGYKIIDLQDPTNPQDATTKSWVEAHVANEIAGLSIGSTVTSLNSLSDVTTTGAGTNGRFIVYNNGTTSWEVGEIDSNDIENVLSGVTIANINNLSGLTLNVATELNEKIDRDGTVAMLSSLNMGNNRIVNLVDPLNAQDATSRSWVENQISTAVSGIVIPADTNTFLSSGSLNSASGELTLTLNNASTVNVTGVFLTPANVSGYLPTFNYSPAPSTSLDEQYYPVTDTISAVKAIDNLLERRNQRSRTVVSLTTAAATISVPPFVCGHNKLMVFVNGQKQIANERAFAVSNFVSLITKSTVLSLTPATTYELAYTTPTGSGTISILGSLVDSFGSLIAQMNTQVTGGKFEIFYDGIDVQLILTADSPNSTSTCTMADTGTGLLAAIGAGTSSSVAGQVWDYSEIGAYGDVQQTITFTSTLPIGTVVECYVL